MDGPIAGSHRRSGRAGESHERSAQVRAAAVVAASARARIASRRVARLVRNFIPVVGIYFFGWSAGALGVQLLVRRIHRARRDHRRAGAARDARIATDKSGAARGPVKSVLLGVVDLGVPRRHRRPAVLDRADSARRHACSATRCASTILHTPVLVGDVRRSRREPFLEGVSLGYDAMPDNELKQRARWDVYLLVLRAVAMFMMAAHGLAFIIVPLMAILLSYLEIWPERVLGAVFGDPAKLYEHDPDGTRSPKKRKT